MGRAREYEALAARLKLASSGNGSVVLIEGEAGVGKSRLAAACAQTAADHEFVVRSASAHELARDRPFGLVADALGVVPGAIEEPHRRLAGLLAADRGPGAGLRFRILDELVDLAETLANRAPLLIALEDIHWADPSTLLAVDRLGAGVGSLPILVVLTCRPTPRPPEVLSVIEHVVERGGLELALESLDPAACTALARAALGAAPSAGLERLLGQAGGNPFFLLEMLGALLDEHAIRIDGDVAETPSSVVPPSVRIVVLRRLGFLSDPALEVLRLAAVLGTSFSLEELAVVSRRAAANLLGPVTELLRAGVVGETDSRLVFRHELVRDAVYHDLPASVRADLHRETGHLLAAAGANAERVATHLALGARPGDLETVRWLQRAARDVVSRDPQTAGELLAQASGLARVGGTVPVELAHDHAQALLWAGDHRQAEVVARNALESVPDPTMEAVLRRRLGEALFLQGRTAEASAEVERAVRVGLPADAVGRALAEAAGAAILGGDLERGARLSDEALARAGSQTGERPDGLALTVRAWVADLRGDFELSASLVERAVREADRADPVAALYGTPQVILGAFLAGQGASDLAERVLEQARHTVERAGAVWEMPVIHGATGLLHMWRGTWDDAVAEIETSLTWTREHGSTLGAAWPLSVLARIQVHRGQLAAAESRLATATDLVGHGRPTFGMAWLMWANAELREAHGDAEAAIASLESGLALADGFGTVTQFIDIGPELVRLLMRNGRADRAAVVAARVERADGSASPLAAAAAIRARGLADDDGERLVEAAARFEAGPRRVVASFVAEDAGGALARAGRRDEAVESLCRAADGYERLRAIWDLRRVEAALRTLGVRRGRRGARQRAATGWSSLSETERRVADLVASGLTNRQIGERLYISARTVETHLSHVFAKLELSSRVELAAEAARRSSSD